MKLKKGSWCIPCKAQHLQIYVALTQFFQPVFLALPAQPRTFPLLCVHRCTGGLQLAWSAQPWAVPLLCAPVVYLTQPALPWSALIFFAPGLFGADAAVQQQPFPIAQDATCLSHPSVFSTCAKSYPFVQFKYSVYGQSYRTPIHVLQCSHASVGLAPTMSMQQL